MTRRERERDCVDVPSDWIRAGIPNVVFSIIYFWPTVTPNTNLSYGTRYPAHMLPPFKRTISSYFATEECNE